MQSLPLVDTIKKIHEKFKPKNYLEVSDEYMGLKFLNLANPDTKITGVCYWPCVDQKQVGDNVTIYPVTADYYAHSAYMTNNYKADMVLIDGCFKVEVITKFFILLNYWLADDGIMLITHTAPSNPDEAIRAKFGDISTSKHGDGYRFLNILKKNNTSAHQILCDDGGLLVLQKTDVEPYLSNMLTLIRDALNITFEERVKDYDISPEDYFSENS